MCSCVCATSSKPVAPNFIPTTTFSRGSEHTLVQTIPPTRTSLTQTGASLSTVWQNVFGSNFSGRAKKNWVEVCSKASVKLSSWNLGSHDFLQATPMGNKSCARSAGGRADLNLLSGVTCANTGRVCFAGVSNNSQCSVITQTLRTMYTERFSFWKSGSLCNDILL